MPKDDLKPEGHFERVPNMDGEFRVVTTHEYPMGWLLGKLGVAPLREKWEQGTVGELERVSKSLQASKPGMVMHPAFIRYEEDMAEWGREQGKALHGAVREIKAQLDREFEAAHPPVTAWEDPVI